MYNPIDSLDVAAAEEHHHETAREYRCCCGLLHARDGIRVFAAITMLIAGIQILMGVLGIGATALIPYKVTSGHIDQLSSRLGASHASSSALEKDDRVLYTLGVMTTVVTSISIIFPLVEFTFALLVFFGVARRKSWLIVPYMADQLLSFLISSALVVATLFALFYFMDTGLVVAFLLGLIYFGLYAAYTGITAWTAWKTIRWVRHVKLCEGNRIRMSTIMTPAAPIYYKQ